MGYSGWSSVMETLSRMLNDLGSNRKGGREEGRREEARKKEKGER